MGRIYTQLNEDFDKYKLALTYIATVRGIPQIYYGTEILMKNPGTDDHGIIRSDFPGGWKNDKVNAFTGKGLSAKEKEAQGFVKKLMNWRKNSTLVHSGKLMHFAPKNQDEIYVMFRYDDKEKIMIVLNKNTKDMELDLKPYKEILGDQLTGKDVLSGTEFTKAKKISVKAMGAMIIEVE